MKHLIKHHEPVNCFKGKTNVRETTRIKLLSYIVMESVAAKKVDAIQIYRFYNSAPLPTQNCDILHLSDLLMPFLFIFKVSVDDLLHIGQ